MFDFVKLPEQWQIDILVNVLRVSPQAVTEHIEFGNTLAVFAQIRAHQLGDPEWFTLMCALLHHGWTVPGVGDYFDKPCQQWLNKKGIPDDR